MPLVQSPSQPVLWFSLHPAAVRVILGIGAILIVASGLSVVIWLCLSAHILPKAPSNPFGLTLREVTPSSSGLGGAILFIQLQFYNALMSAVKAMKSEGAAALSLAGIGFLYGIFHAAGPGHGKGVISAYIIANRRSHWSGLGMSVAAALLQGTVAVCLVSFLHFFMNATSASINSAARAIEIGSFACIAIAGAIHLWLKASDLESFLRRWSAGLPTDEAEPAIPRKAADQNRQYIGVIIAAGIRPCTGALLLLVFASTQGLYWAGVVGAYAMAVGTAVTTGSIGLVAVLLKSSLLKVTADKGKGGVAITLGIELLAAAFILLLGLVLLSGASAISLPTYLD